MIFLQAALAVPFVIVIISTILFFGTIIPILIYNSVVGRLLNKKNWILNYSWVLLISSAIAIFGVAIFVYKMLTFEGTLIN